MLAVPWREPFSDPGWLFEPKWDGYRTIVSFDGHELTATSRAGNDLTLRYPELAALAFDRPLVLDGEVVVLDSTGRPSFEALQRRRGESADGPGSTVRLVAFDLLSDGTAPLVDLPIEERFDRLDAIDLPGSVARSPVIVGDGLDLWGEVIDRDLEGMVAKRLGSTYRPGVRSPDWRKIHHVNNVRAVVGGFSPGKGGRAASFGSLLLGHWEGDRLRYAGSVGTGFSDAELSAIRSALDELSRRDSPFHPDEDLPREVVWVEPVLVASVGYRNWTGAGRLRHPRFRGFTDDPADSITLEAERQDGGGE